MRSNRGFTMVELLLVLAIVAVVAGVVAWVIYAPWVLLWCLKSMGFSQVAYTSQAWWGALVMWLLFTGSGVVGYWGLRSMIKRSQPHPQPLPDLSGFAQKFRNLAEELNPENPNPDNPNPEHHREPENLNPDDRDIYVT